MNDIGRLESCFQPLERRTPPQTLFFRVIGRDAGGQILALLERWRLAAEESGACLLGLENPTRGEICRFRNQVGEQFELDAGFVWARSVLRDALSLPPLCWRSSGNCRPRGPTTIS